MRKLLIGFLILATLGLAATATTKTRRSAKPSQASDQVDADTRLCRDAAHTLISQFGRELKGKISGSMKKGGLLRTITVCGDSASQIAVSRSGGGWTIRRISSMNLQEAIPSDSVREAVLAAFRQARKTRPTFKDHWTADKDSSRTYHFYEPIIAQDFCLRCHGAKESINQQIADSISSHYPGKPTFGFKNGDLIGVFVVESKWPDGRAQALALTGRSR